MIMNLPRPSGTTSQSMIDSGVMEPGNRHGVVVHQVVDSQDASTSRSSGDVERSTMKPFKPQQRLSLDTAVAPLLDRPTAPFHKSERRRARTSAVFYSECFLRGIDPTEADNAAAKAQGTYDRWWVKATHHDGGKEEHSVDQPVEAMNESTKKRKREFAISTSFDESVFPGTEQSDAPMAKKVFPANMNAGEVCQGAHLQPAIDHAYSNSFLARSIDEVKRKLINELKENGGSTSTKTVQGYVEYLETYFRSCHWDSRDNAQALKLEGDWLTISKPMYEECAGRTEIGEYRYTLGRVSFDMFRPTNLMCSIKAVFNSVRQVDVRNPERPLHVPKSLMKDVHSGAMTLRTYDIMMALSIEGGQNRKGEKASGTDYVVPRPVQAILTNQGYMLSDPNNNNRLSVWFSGGSLEVEDEERDLEEWKRIFDFDKAPGRDFREHANILAAKLLLGAHPPEKVEEDGSMNFLLKRPIGGHGSAFCDILFLDDNMRIMRGHHGSVYVCTRIPS